MTREEAIKKLKSQRNVTCNGCLHAVGWCESHCGFSEAIDMAIEALKAQLFSESTTKDATSDLISRQAAIDALDKRFDNIPMEQTAEILMLRKDLRELPPAQPEQRYTEEELRVFQHGISLSLLSKRSAQHWRYDEDTATEIKFLERLYDKVVADMGGEQDGH